MGQLTGRLKADFSDFNEAVDKSAAKLTDFQDDAGKVEKSLNRMVDSFSGRRVIQDATLMAEAIERLGGTTKITEDNLARASATAKQAAEQLRLGGEKVPKNIEDLAGAVGHLGDESEKTATKGSTLASSYGAVDKTLGAVGIHLGPEAKALSELGEMSGKTASQLGLLASAGAVVAAAMAGWKFGRWIAEMTGTDKIIGDATAGLLGWTTAAGGAGSAADTLARASAAAGRSITSFDEALRINTETIKKRQAGLFQEVAPERAVAQVKAWHDEIARLAKSGVLESLKKDLAANVLSQKELGDLYQVSGGALRILGTELSAHKERLDRINEANTKAVELQDRLFGRELAAKAQEYSAAIGDVTNATKLLPSAAAEVNKTLIETVDHLSAVGLGASASAVHFRELILATTDWAAVNAKVAALPDPFADMNRKRSDAFRQTQVDQMNLNQGVVEGGEYWRHAGEIADQAMADAAAAATETTAAVVEQKGQVDSLATSYTVVSRSAAEWRAIAAGLQVDAARTKASAIQGNDAFGNISRYADFLSSAAGGASSLAGYNQQREAAIANAVSPGAWGAGGGWTVNVNATQGIDGDQIASELVSGMRRRGVSPGSA